MPNLPLLFSLLFLTPSMLPAQSIVNGDFEAPLLTPASVPGWRSVRLDERVGAAAGAELGGGKQCLRIYRTYDSEGAYSFVQQTVPLSPGRYRIKVDARVEGIADPPGARMFVYGGSGSKTLSVVDSDNVRGTTDWNELSVTYIAPDHMDSLTIGCILVGAGDAYFDNISIETVDTDSLPETSEEALLYLAEFLEVAKREVLDSDSIDWEALKNEGRRYAIGAQTPADVYPTLRILLQKVNKHSFLIPPAVTNAAGVTTGGNLVSYAFPTGRLTGSSVGQINLPQVSGPTDSLTPYADSLQRLIARLENEGARSWIVDLRSNTGGNCWPMLAGLGPLFQGDTLGFFQQRDGSEAVSWNYVDGEASMAGAAPFSVSAPAYRLRHPTAKVAVLTGPQTMSSGEVVAVAFRGQKNARSFGRATGGYSTTNDNFVMSDGAILVLTVSVYADRAGNVYGEEIQPNVLVPDRWHTVDRAIEWLKENKD